MYALKVEHAWSITDVLWELEHAHYMYSCGSWNMQIAYLHTHLQTHVVLLTFVARIER